MNVFNSAVTWIKGLFADPVAGLTTLLGTIAAGYGTFLDFITAPLKKGIAWVLRLFGWDEAAEKTETFSFKDTIMGVFNKAVTWIKSLFSDPVAALTTALATIAGGYLTIGDFVIAPLKMAIAWVLRLFGWDEAAEATETFSFSGTIMGVFESAKKWIMSLFSWSQEPVKEGDSFIVKTIKGVVKTIKEWCGSMFKFDIDPKASAPVSNLNIEPNQSLMVFTTPFMVLTIKLSPSFTGS
jgi:hypothetical protein